MNPKVHPAPKMLMKKLLETLKIQPCLSMALNLIACRALQMVQHNLSFLRARYLTLLAIYFYFLKPFFDCGIPWFYWSTRETGQFNWPLYSGSIGSASRHPLTL